MRLSDIGEIKTIEFIKKITKRRQKKAMLASIGDDACILKDGTVITTDSYSDKVHFDLSYITLKEVGARIACATLSDIAAVGALPIGLFVSLFLPKNFTVKGMKELYQGMEEICQIFSCEIGGGDIITCPKLSLSLTAVGKTKKPILRSTARPGDSLYITGSLGLAETGRLVLKKGLRRVNFKKAVARHIKPIPRIFEAQLLRSYATSMIDTSDGLSTDAYHLSKESRVKIRIFYDELPIHKETKELEKILGLDLKEFILNSGEDYELLFTARKVPRLKIPVKRIGLIEEGRGLFLVCGRGESEILPGGYDHLSFGVQRVPRCMQCQETLHSKSKVEITT